MSDASLPTPSRSPATTAPPPTDFTALDRLVDASGSTCTLVMRGDEVVHEHPAGSRDATRRVYSITKSIVGVLLAIAAAEDELSLDDPVSRHVPRWPAESGDVTIRHLMSMTSGRAWTEALDGAMIRAADQTSAALATGQQNTPGATWQYDNLASQVLSAVLTSAVGDIETYADARLFTPLGLTDTSWSRDRAGSVTTYAGIVSSCADLARLAVMMRDQGRFAGRQVVPAAAVSELTTPSSDLNAAYGLLWWTNAEGRVQEVRRAAGFEQDREPYRGRLSPAAPPDAFWALGWGNQLIAVVPSADTVAVRLGPKPAGPDDLTIDGFTAAVLEGLGIRQP
ncbi:serine hydrolase domain-containing protein [Aeromicrobium duanguangcaii]|uniref:Beta-lactamase family protein n=1 Tax=Aeromicrobium duanguangcaii TaxID=2968086 RepID=A0ABY5KJR1_9ACTN|nr:serine hydrolase domain-containing protein [Aeromicrobium duanguangcaii]MCD9153183.1 beta-lactamase family protein [Aeromicrobium duanguangcaii]UUI69716.1 beta-lactamase family protein [Aeromicrobium duanguangcaii]